MGVSEGEGVSEGNCEGVGEDEVGVRVNTMGR